MNLQKLKELSIERVAENLGMTIQKHKALCPFHNDRHPSLSFHTRKNTFKCFVCDAHGGVIDLAMQVLGKNFKETCHWLGAEGTSFQDSSSKYLNRWSTPEKVQVKRETCNLKPEASFEASRFERFFERPFLNTPAQTFLFQERKLHPAVIRWCRLTSWTDRYGTPWLQIPYYNTDGKLIGIQNRRLAPNRHPTPLLRGAGVCHERSEGSVNPQPSTLNPPRFKFPKGSKCNIYNLPILKLLKEGEELWITEGCSDCWAMLSAGRKAIAIPSATLLNPKDLDVLRTQSSKLITLHMSPDNDEPGERLFLQLKTLFPQLVRHPLPIGIKDFGQHWAQSHEQ